MIGTYAATILMVLLVLSASVLAIAVGGVSSLLMRRAWGLKTALVDAALAAIFFLAAAEAITTIAITFNAWNLVRSPITVTLAIALASVVTRHLLGLGPFSTRRSHLQANS